MCYELERHFIVDVKDLKDVVIKEAVADVFKSTYVDVVVVKVVVQAHVL